MGQQQILLLILATFVVSLTIAMAIMAFHNAEVKTNEDAVYRDLLIMATKVEGCFRKPTLLGGVARTTNLAAITSFHQLGYYEHDADDNLIIPDKTYHNENADYRLLTGDTLVIEALPAEKPERRILCRCTFSPDNKKLLYTIEQVTSAE